MNRTKPFLPLIVAVLMLSGCASIAPGNDAVVVNAERTTVLALDTFDLFLRWEFENRDALSAMPEIKQAADYVRTHAPAWLGTARDLTKAYKESRTPENKANLQTITALLRRAVANAQQYMPKD